MRNKDLEYKDLNRMFTIFRLQRGTAYGVIIIAALLAFEVFNYSTTDFALTDLLGNLDFLGVRWATILAIAACGLDFAGIARLFTPQKGSDEPAWVLYLFGAWLLAATMNAMLTWWAVSIAILNHETVGTAVVARATLLRVVPIFVAVLVWLLRVLIIGTFSVAGDRLFSQAEVKPSPSWGILPSRPRAVGSQYHRPEPTYHPVSMDSGNPKSPPNKEFTVASPFGATTYGNTFSDFFEWASHIPFIGLLIKFALRLRGSTGR